MIKITVLASDEELGQLFKETFDDHDESVYKDGCNKNEYELEVIIEYEHEKIKKMKIEADVVVARGYAAYLLRDREYSVPVVEMPVTANDVIRALYESKIRYSTTNAVVIGTKNIIFQVERLFDFLGSEVRPMLLSEQSDEEIARVFALMNKSNDSVIIGGRKVCEYAEKQGIRNIMIKSGRITVWQAITEAKRAAYISRIEQEKAMRFKSILDYTSEGIFVINQNKKVSMMNSSCQKILGMHVKDVLGKKVEEIFRGSNLLNLINQEDECIDEVIKWRGMQVAVNKGTVVLKEENIGMVVTFQNVTKIQETEGRIREKIHNRGLVAKHTFYDIIGASRELKDTIETAKKLSQVDSNVLIVGNTGTGKELFSQSIHNFSKRKNGPFVAINCAAIPENLLESELFGYVEGAFTGATKGGKPGLFELAHRGTIFLDEISEISLKLQGRLLRVLQEREIMRLGDDKVIPVDIRIISATNKELNVLVKEGRFREDLYYRLDVLKIRLPALDKRKEDIPLLTENFIELYSNKIGKAVTITEQAKQLLQTFDWQGNIRELKNACERLIVLSSSDLIDKDEVARILEEKMVRHSSETSGDTGLLSEDDSIFKEEIQALLVQEGYSKSKVAKKLGIDRTTLWRRMKKYGII
ncbi:MAG: sigma 54-interacting transcriptional regulator [Clostridia bacterium]